MKTQNTCKFIKPEISLRLYVSRVVRSSVISINQNVIVYLQVRRNECGKDYGKGHECYDYIGQCEQTIMQ